MHTICYSFASSFKTLEKLKIPHPLQSNIYTVIKTTTLQQVDPIPTLSLLLLLNRVKHTYQWNIIVHYLQLTLHLPSLSDILSSNKYVHFVAAGNSHSVQSVSCIVAFLLNHFRISSSSRTNREIRASNMYMSEEHSLFSLLGPKAIFKIAGLVPNERIICITRMFCLILKDEHHNPKLCMLKLLTLNL